MARALQHHFCVASRSSCSQGDYNLDQKFGLAFQLAWMQKLHMQIGRQNSPAHEVSVKLAVVRRTFHENAAHYPTMPCSKISILRRHHLAWSKQQYQSSTARMVVFCARGTLRPRQPHPGGLVQQHSVPIDFEQSARVEACPRAVWESRGTRISKPASYLGSRRRI
eukprot:SAG31_NODE_3324_length_4411_cov_1.686456_2_plen_166_part_00